jgi:hypothetical protein
MNSDELWALDLKTLSNLYSQCVENLNTRLLEGASWEELSELRYDLTHIGVSIDMKLAENNVKVQKL